MQSLTNQKSVKEQLVHLQVGGKLVVGTSGTSPLKPSEVALLEVSSVEELIASKPEQWQTLQRSSRAQVI